MLQLMYFNTGKPASPIAGYILLGLLILMIGGAVYGMLHP